MSIGRPAFLVFGGMITYEVEEEGNEQDTKDLLALLLGIVTVGCHDQNCLPGLSWREIKPQMSDKRTEAQLSFYDSSITFSLCLSHRAVHQQDRV